MTLRISAKAGCSELVVDCDQCGPLHTHILLGRDIDDEAIIENLRKLVLATHRSVEHRRGRRRGGSRK